jgi:hypothetical protein
VRNTIVLFNTFSSGSGLLLNWEPGGGGTATLDRSATVSVGRGLRLVQAPWHSLRIVNHGGRG